MHRSLRYLIPLAVLLLVVAGCNSRTDKADSGGVVLSVSEYDGVPLQVGVTAANEDGFVSIESITLENYAINPDLDSTDLMTIELETYEVTFSRNDTGTRTPVPMVRKIGGSVEEGGTADLGNLVILTREQLDNPPLSDLQAVNGGFDRETGSDVIVLNLSLRFFGRTIAGNPVVSNAFGFTVNFLP